MGRKINWEKVRYLWESTKVHIGEIAHDCRVGVPMIEATARRENWKSRPHPTLGKAPKTIAEVAMKVDADFLDDLPFNPDYHPVLAASLLRDGWNKSKIAKKFGIKPCTLDNWCKVYPSFGVAMQQTKEAVCAEIELALIKKAKGGKTREIKRNYAVVLNDEIDIESGTIEKVPKRALVEEVVTDKEIQPDTKAAEFILTNLKPEVWSNKVEAKIVGDPKNPVHHQVAGNLQIDLTKLTDDELALLMSISQKMEQQEEIKADDDTDGAITA